MGRQECSRSGQRGAGPGTGRLRGAGAAVARRGLRPSHVPALQNEF